MTDTAPITYTCEDRIAVIAMDDGKANALSHDMFDQLNTALDKAEAAGAVVILTGRAGMFCGGFHLPTMMQGIDHARKLLGRGGEFAHRILTSPSPIIVAASGHAMAMGTLLLMTADYALGIDEGFKIGMNEVAIGMTMPQIGIEIAHARLSPPYMRRVMNNAETLSPQNAVRAGLIHQIVPADKLMDTAYEVAAHMKTLHPTAFADTKLKSVAALLAAIKQAEIADKDATIVN